MFLLPYCSIVLDLCQNILGIVFTAMIFSVESYYIPFNGSPLFSMCNIDLYGILSLFDGAY